MNLEFLAQKSPFLTVLIDDFNGKSKNWCNQDSTNFEGIANKNLAAQFGLSQTTNKATHISQSCSSCIDLIFTTHLNLVAESNVCIHIVTIRLYLQNLIYKYITHRHT